MSLPDECSTFYVAAAIYKLFALVERSQLGLFVAVVKNRLCGICEAGKDVSPSCQGENKV